MVQRNGYPDGEPCWADVTTPDLARAQAFYRDLFGWEYQDSGPEFGNYSMGLKEGRYIAGITPPMPGADAPSAWTAYLASSDANATAASVRDGGGTIVVEPLEIPGSGTMVVGIDPTGAFFGVWQAGEHRGSGLASEPGSPCWAELSTRDGPAADAFYRRLFPYEKRQLDVPGADIAYWSIGGRDIASRVVMGPEYGDMPPHWTVYFAVDDADAAAERVRGGGGRVFVGPFDSSAGRIALVADPFGAAFGLIDLSRKTGG